MVEVLIEPFFLAVAIMLIALWFVIILFAFRPRSRTCLFCGWINYDLFDRKTCPNCGRKYVPEKEQEEIE